MVSPDGSTFGLLDTLINAPLGSEARSALWRLLKVGFRHGHGDPAADAAAVNDLFSRSMMRKSKSDLERLMDREAEKRGFFHSLFQMIVLPIYFFSFSFKLTQWFFTSLFFEPAAAWMWRTRRYLADATSVQLTRNPDALARGLQRLGGFAGLVPCGAWSAPLFFAGNDSGESLSRAEVEKRFEQLRRRGFKLPTLDQLEAGRPEALEACAALSAQFAAAREESGDDSAGGFVSFHPPMKRRLKRLAAQGARWAASGTQRTAKERAQILVAALVLAPILGLVALLLLVAVALCIGLNLVFLGVAMGVILILFRLLPR